MYERDYQGEIIFGFNFWEQVSDRPFPHFKGFREPLFLKIFISTENDNKNYLRIMYDVRVQMRQKEIRLNVLMQAINSS